MFAGIADLVVQIVKQYGFVALFIYMILETGFILHFAPSEIVVPVAASVLVKGPVTFVLFVLDATAGATLGSVLIYYIFKRYGVTTLSRYGKYVHVSESEIERSQGWFQRWGESSVLWGRFLPLLRAAISIPAGLAEMEIKKFTIYSASGAFVFNATLTYLVYSGSDTSSPLGVVISQVQQIVKSEILYARTHQWLLIVVLGAVVLLGIVIWWARDWIRQQPDTAKMVALHIIRVGGIVVGGILVLGALLSPHRTFVAVTGAWNDPEFFVELGASPQFALVLSGIAFVGGGILVFLIGRRIPIEYVQERVQSYRRTQ